MSRRSASIEAIFEIGGDVEPADFRKH